MKRTRNQDGLASIVIVGVLVVLLALITLGFSRIMDRAVNNSLNNQLSAAANYAAQSAVNDAMAYIKGQSNPSDVSSNDCTTLLKEPGLSNLADLSGDGNTKITCLMVNTTPTDLLYQQLPANNSQIIKATTTDAVDKVMFSWQSTDRSKNQFPSSSSFPSTTSWSNSNYAPILRVGLYPVPPSGQISGIQANSKTFFLVPHNGGSGNVYSFGYSTADGSVEQVNCNAKNVTGFDSDTTTSGYDCSAIITGLYGNISPDSYYYITLTPMYGQADVRIKADNTSQQAVQFEQVQTVIDATATANNAAKRLQERVDSNTTGENISATADAAPDFAVRSAIALCKQIEFHHSYYDFVLNDAPGLCSSGSGSIPPVTPTLTLTITGNNGNDSGVTRDSGDATPGGSGYSGVVYVDSAATVNWKSTDSATYCNASGGWSGDKNPSSLWTGVTGTGSQGFTGISTYTTYSMQCKGPGGTTPTKTVTAWPPPRVSMSGPGSYQAGNSYTISWSAVNASKCTISSSGNEPWNQTYTGLNPAGSSDSRGFGTNWNDDSGKSYSITCWDPIGRPSSTATWTVGRGGGNTSISPPSCDATTNVWSNGDGTASFSWTGNCPVVAPDGGTYCIYSTTDSDPSVNACNVYRNGGPFRTGVRAVGQGNQNFCFGIRASAGVWGQLKDYNSCPNYIQPPPMSISISNTAIRLNQGSGKCGDYTHLWVMCPRWTVSQTNASSSQIRCYVSWNGSQKSGWIYGSPSTYTIGFSATASESGYLDVNCHSDFFGNNQDQSVYVPPSADYYNPNPPPPPPPPPPGNPPGGGGNPPSGGGGGAGCFIAGTPVLTPYGTMPIEQLRSGDAVETWDLSTNRMVRSTIVETYIHHQTQTLYIVTSAGSVTTTPGHIFWSDKGWVKADQLVPGKSRVLDSNGQWQKVILSMLGQKQTVYNLHIANADHDYFAGGILVHNRSMIP